MIEQLYEWEGKIRNEDNSLRQRNILLNLLEKLQTGNLNIYDNHSLRRIAAFESRRDDEYMPQYELVMEKRRLRNRIVRVLQEQYNLYILPDNKGKSVCDARTVEELQSRAAMGDEKALYDLGLHMACGSKDKPADLVKAGGYFRQSAALGYAPAMSRIGDLYYNGDGLVQDDELALQWYEKAVRQDFHMAMMQAGRMYYLGRGTRQDFCRAMDLFYAVATVRENFFMVRRYNSLARQYVGQMYERGEGVPQDMEEALHWYRLATEDERNHEAATRVHDLLNRQKKLYSY